MRNKMPLISLVIPAFNEELYLPLLLDSIDSARQRYEAGPDEVEIIVVDMGRRTVLRTLREHVAAASFTQRSAPSQLRGMVARGLQMVRSSLLSTPIRRSTRGRSTQSTRPWRRAASSLERPASATAECPRVSHSQRSSRSLFSDSQDSMLASCFVGAPIGKPSGVITKTSYGPRTQSFSSHLSDSVAPAGNALRERKEHAR
jgi:hypothetical protein